MTDFKETNNLQSKIKKMKKELDRMNKKEWKQK